MAPRSTVRRSPIRALVSAAVLTSCVGLGISGAVSHPTAVASPATVSHAVTSTTHRPVVLAHRIGSPAAAPDQSPSAEPSAVATPAPATPAPETRAPAAAAPASRAVAAPVRQAPPANPAPPAPPAPAPVSFRNHLGSDDGSLNTGVGYYGDCSGATALSHAYAAIDGCVGGRLYFVGHNPGVFGPLMHMGVGSVITYWDNNGTAHAMRVVGARVWYRSNGVPNLINGASVEFQTCITADGSVDRILDAVYI